MVFPVVLRGQPGPRLATTPTRTTTSKPVVPWGFYCAIKCSCQTPFHGPARRLASPRDAYSCGDDAGGGRSAARSGARRLAPPAGAAGRPRRPAREVQGRPAAASEAEAADDVGLDARLGRGLQPDLGLEVRRRLRAAAARARDGARDPTAARGDRGERA